MQSRGRGWVQNLGLGDTGKWEGNKGRKERISEEVHSHKKPCQKKEKEEKSSRLNNTIIAYWGLIGFSMELAFQVAFETRSSGEPEIASESIAEERRG